MPSAYPKKPRVERIDEYRQNQPETELRRKANKARRAGLWTQEDIDLGHAVARELSRRIVWE